MMVITRLSNGPKFRNNSALPIRIAREMPTKRAKPFFEFSHKFRIVAVHLDADPRNRSPLPTPFPFIMVLDRTIRAGRNGDPADIPPLRGQKNRFRNKTDTIPANNFDHGCATRGRGGKREGRGGFYVGIIYRSKAFMENWWGRERGGGRGRNRAN